MLKKEVTYTAYRDGEEREISETLRFVYTLAAVKMYEQNTGRRFFDDYGAALGALTGVLKGKSLSNIDGDEEARMALLPLACEPTVSGFMQNFIPCLYAEVCDGVLLQSEETHDNAAGSYWLMPLANAAFFLEVFAELNRGSLPAATRKKKQGAS
jgi:hypothetical protein